MSTTRKPRKKVTTDLGRQIMQRERQRLAKEQAALAEQLAEDAIRQRRRAAMNARREPDPIVSVDTAIQRSIVRRVAGVLASEGLNPQIECSATRNKMVAWTDFKKIHVEYFVYDDIRLTAAILRGEFYHEGGHISFTVPFLDLVEMAREKNPELAEKVEPMPTSGSVTPSPVYDRRKLHHAWNVLEDQRMETAVVSASPRKAGYFTPMVMGELLNSVDQAANNWPILVWRKYLPEHVVAGAKRWFIKLHNERGLDGAKIAADIERITNTYVLSTDPVEMLQAVIELHDILATTNPVTVINDHNKQGRRPAFKMDDNPLDPEKLHIPIDPMMIPDDEDEDFDDEDDEDFDDEDDEDPDYNEDPDFDIDPDFDHIVYDFEGDDEEGGGGPAPSEPEGAEPEGGWQGGETDPDEDESSDSASKGSVDSDSPDGGEEDPDDDELTEEDLNEAREQAEHDRLKDPTLDVDVEAYKDMIERQQSTLQVAPTGFTTDVLEVASATNLGLQLQTAFEAATSQIAPSWHEDQRRGVLNVRRYVTRQPGDVEFFRGYVDNGAPGCDIAVSVLLDNSGSMGNEEKALAQVGYACKTACDRLNVPCTVLLWNTGATVLYDAAERATELPIVKATGGTNPSQALNDLDNHTAGKAKHIVLIMTDDDWSNNAPRISHFHQDGRIIIGLVKGGSAGAAEKMVKRGATMAFDIKDLQEIPRYLEDALVSAAFS